MSQVLEDSPFEIALNETIARLKLCQSERGYTSCFECEGVLACKLRLEYVKAVHESMNEGKGGGFDF